MDEVIGPENFVATIVWEKAESPATLHAFCRFTTVKGRMRLSLLKRRQSLELSPAS